MFIAKSLTPTEISFALDTVSSNTFFMLVLDAIVSRKELSAVRMGDGERHLLDWCDGKPLPEIIDGSWQKRMGVEGISKEELKYRLTRAAITCTHFAPSLTGIQRPEFELYSCFTLRGRYIDNFFCNAWTEEMKIQLFQTAKHVLFIHRNPATADAMQIRAKWGLDPSVKVSYLKLTNWQESEVVVERARSIEAPLVLFSAGPASKYIGPEIAKTGSFPRVTLDIGNAADYWTLNSLRNIGRKG